MAGRGKLNHDQKTSLRYALPYLIFVGIPVLDIFQAGVWSWVQFFSLSMLAAMVAIYVWLWIAVPVAPLSSHLSRKFWIPYTLLIVVILLMVLVGGRANPGLVFMWAYAATPWVLLGPQKYIGGGIVVLVAATVITGLAVKMPLGLMVTAAVVGMLSSLMVFIVRKESQKYQIEDTRRVTEHQLELERERAQMNSDLHDILGQDLTGVSIKADLAVRLMEAGRTEEAHAEMQDVAKLARQAMSDVRAVVSSRREWSIDHELSGASDILAARGVTLHLDRSDAAFPGQVQGAIARVIREAVTNLVRHSDALNCWIRLTPESLLVSNDGCRRASRALRDRHSGGLEQLKDRVSSIGELTWDQDGSKWYVRFNVNPDPSPGAST